MPNSSPRNLILIHVALAVLNLLVFAQTLGHPFINYDDAQFVFQNEHVKAGLASSSFRWAWTSLEQGYYPLTWLSHMLDVELFGLSPGGHHATALLLHILATTALFIALQRLTGNAMKSAVVAALFAIHPMHVESVAWVAERKDTLSTLFGMLALALYPRFVRERSTRIYVLLALVYAASLLAKQMLVTLPFVFLLLDWWPLQRRDWKRAVIEKTPLFALTLAAAAVAYFGQKSLNAVQSTELIPMSARIGNAIVSYAAYIGKLFWPVNLAVLYPYTLRSASQVFFATLLLAAITALAWALRRKASYVLTGWLWFLGTLVPVIGFVTIGVQSIADRYTYFPYIGLFLALVWGVSDLVANKKVLVPVTAVVIVILTALAFRQTRFWRSSETLFAHAIEVTGPNAIMEYCLGQTINLTEPDRSLEHIRRAIELADGRTVSAQMYAQFHVGAGNALLLIAHRERADTAAANKMLDEAEADFRRAIELDPSAKTANARKNLEEIRKMRPAAPAPAAAAPARNPEIAALFQRAMTMLQAGDLTNALDVLNQATRLEPEALDARIYLALAYIQARRPKDAIVQLEIAKKLNPEQANDILTQGMRLRPHPTNLEMLIARLRMSP